MTASALHVYPHFNAEEAAGVAAEFVQSLDNLPGEVMFLLQEIQEKDERINQLVARINQRHYALTKSVKSLSSTATPASASFTLPIPAGAEIPTAHLTPKDAQSVGKIQAEWGKIEALQDEKLILAQRLERIVGRARDRGKAEWKRVGGMDIDELDNVKLGDLGGADVLLPASGLGSGTTKRGRKPALPLAAAITAGSGALSRGASPAGGSASRGGSMPPPPAPRGGSTGRGRGRPKRQSVPSDEEEAEAEAEVASALETEIEAEADDQPYCFCQQKSYGEMIGCDNDKCPYEWFHVKCVNIDGPLPDTWYCPDCVKTLGFTSSDGSKPVKDRKGRKK